VLTWLAYSFAALLMLAAVVGVTLSGLALWFVAELLQGLNHGEEEGDAQGAREEGEKG
jgi:hypothetical protein